MGGTGKSHDHEGEDGHDHAHEHGHDHGDDQIYKGYFKDDQVKDRALTDWAGDWQSVYPYLKDGTLDPVMAHKAEEGDKSAEEYKAYYDIGYSSAMAIVFFILIVALSLVVLLMRQRMQWREAEGQ